MIQIYPANPHQLGDWDGRVSKFLLKTNPFKRFLYFRAVSSHTHTNPVRVKATVREGHGKLQPNINVPSTTVQKLSHETSISHNWPPETMMSGKFPAHKNSFDRPSVSLGNQFVYETMFPNRFGYLCAL